MDDISESLQADGFTVAVIRTARRKTMAIKVRAGQVELRVPRATSVAEIADLVSRKTGWIRNKLLHQANRSPPVRRFVTDEQLVYLGQGVRLQVVAGRQRQVVLTDGALQVVVPARVSEPEQYVRGAVQGWFRAAAQEYLAARIANYVELVGAAPTAIKVRRYKARWGSCSRSGKLAFNWLIMVAPPAVVDYVVVHELCHLIHHHHQAEFWEHVAQVMPDYQQQRRWLRENGWQLVV